MLSIHRERMLRLRYVMCNAALKEEMRANDIGPVRTLKDFSISVVGYVTEDQDENICLTAACVVGSAAFDPVLRSHGLDFVVEEDPWHCAGFTQMRRISIVLDGERVKYGNRKLAAFFGLTVSDYQMLVNPAGYLRGRAASAHDVVRRIDWLLLKNTVETLICLDHVISEQAPADLPAPADLVAA